jgi:hypothetical protein
MSNRFDERLVENWRRAGLWRLSQPCYRAVNSPPAAEIVPARAANHGVHRVKITGGKGFAMSCLFGTIQRRVGSRPAWHVSLAFRISVT